MTDRKNWELGASTDILRVNGGYNSDTFKKIFDSGIKNMEISLTPVETAELNFLENPQKIYSMASENGVSFWSHHIVFSETVHPSNLDENDNKFAMEILKKSIRSATKIGVKTIVIHPSSEPNEDFEREEKLKRAVENLKILSDLCNEKGAVLAVENLPRSCLGNHSSEIIRFLEEVPSLMFCFDTNHSLIQTNNEFLDELIKHKMHGRIRTVHISDYDMKDEKHRLPLDGVNDWEGILSKLEELDYNGVFMYEVAKARDREVPYTFSDIKENYMKLIK